MLSVDGPTGRVLAIVPLVGLDVPPVASYDGGGKEVECHGVGLSAAVSSVVGIAIGLSTERYKEHCNPVFISN